MNIELDTGHHSDLFIQIANTVRESYNMIQMAIGSPLRLEKPSVEEDEEKKDDTCPDCNGSGDYFNWKKVNGGTIDPPYELCRRCGGKGTIEED